MCDKWISWIFLMTLLKHRGITRRTSKGYSPLSGSLSWHYSCRYRHLSWRL
jgi:hypothetical protein